MGYFHLPVQLPNDGKLVSWRYVLGAFVVFLVVEIILVPGLYMLWESYQQGTFGQVKSYPIDTVKRGWLNMFAIMCTGIALWTYLMNLPKAVRFQIYQGGALPQSATQNIGNFFMGALTWLIAYPWIILLGQGINIIFEFTHHVPHVDQLAVKHLKEAMEHPFLLAVTCLFVVSIIPAIEELIFRGFLQTWLKGMWGRTLAIIVTSVIFALFHYSSTQGLENIPLCSSLFILSCFLGYIRERQQSLWASIGLHATFNSISIFFILMGKGS